MAPVPDYRLNNVPHIEHAWGPWTSNSPIASCMSFFLKLAVKGESGGMLSFKIDDSMSFRVGMFDGKEYISYKTGEWREDASHPKEHVERVFKRVFPQIRHLLGEVNNTSMQLGVLRLQEDSANAGEIITPNVIGYQVEPDAPIVLSFVSRYCHSSDGGCYRMKKHAPGSRWVNSEVYLVDPTIYSPPLYPEDLVNDIEIFLEDDHISKMCDLRGPRLEHSALLRRYMNSCVRANRFFTTEGYVDFLFETYAKEAERLKTLSGKIARVEAFKTHVSEVSEFRDQFESTIDMSQRMRDLIPRILAMHKNCEIEGLKPVSKHEGLVISHGEMLCKMVDEEFTRDNHSKWIAS